jgi:predicted permease
MVFGDEENKSLALLAFALGIELAQVIVVFVILFLGFLCQTIFRLSKRDWVLVLSSIVVGLVLPILMENNIF